MPGHADDLRRAGGQAENLVGLAPVVEQRIGLGRLPERGQRLAAQQLGQRGQGRRGLGGQRSGTGGGGAQRLHVAGHHVGDGGLDEHRRGVGGLVGLQALGFGHEDLVGAQRCRGAQGQAPAQTLGVGAQGGVEAGLLSLVEVGQRALRLAGEQLVARGLEQPAGARSVVRRGMGGAREGLGGGRVGAALTGGMGGGLERGGDRLVGRERRGGQVPGARGGVLGPGAGERLVRGAPARRRRGVVGGRAPQRVAEADVAALELDDAGGLGALERARVVTVLAQRGEQDVEAGALVGGGEQERHAGVLGEPLEAAGEGAGDPRAGGQRLLERRAAGALLVVEQGRDLGQRQGVAVGGGEQAVGHARRQRGAVRGGGEDLARGGLAQRRQSDAVHAGGLERRAGRVAGGEQDRHALAAQPARGEQDRLGRGLVEPLQVSTIASTGWSSAARASSPSVPAAIAKRWSAPGVVGPSASAPSIAPRWISGRPWRRSSTGASSSDSPAKGRSDSDSTPRARRTVIRRLRLGLAQQARLADPGLAGEQEHPAAPVAGSVHQLAHARTLNVPADQHERRESRCGRGREPAAALTASGRAGRRPRSRQWPCHCPLPSRVESRRTHNHDHGASGGTRQPPDARVAVASRMRFMSDPLHLILELDLGLSGPRGRLVAPGADPVASPAGWPRRALEPRWGAGGAVL